MGFLNSWLQGIIIAVIVTTIIEMILPDGNTKKYVKVVLGIYVVFNIIAPIINQFTNSNFEISSIIDIDKYTKEIKSYETSSTDIDKTNEDSIKQIYINNLKKDIIAKLEEKEYIVNDINIKLENDDTYEIKDITLFIKKIENINENKNKNNEEQIIINEIDTVYIEIQENKNLNINIEESNITENDKKEIKKYLSSVYEIQEKQITINE